MIIFDNLTWQTRSDKPDSDWTNGNAKYVVCDGSELAYKIMNTPAWDAVEDDEGNLIDITEIELPVEEELFEPTIDEQIQELQVALCGVYEMLLGGK